ncbi:MAG TPA: hypothetical protein VGW38_23430 [Chloroflexota bacterium]|nr:hypothetical protein [Chloroflexota bacterium]
MDRPVLSYRMDVVAAVTVAAIVVAAIGLPIWVMRRHWPPSLLGSSQGPLWERPWRQQVLWWPIVALGVALSVVAAIKIPSGGAAEIAYKSALLSILVVAALLGKRQRRRSGVKTPAPYMEYGPPGWVWDEDAATWRPPPNN